jgi:hypothetical protein
MFISKSRLKDIEARLDALEIIGINAREQTILGETVSVYRHFPISTIIRMLIDYLNVELKCKVAERRFSKKEDY